MDEESARRSDLYLTIYNTHNRQTSMPPVGFEHSPSKRAAADPHLRPRGLLGPAVSHALVANYSVVMSYVC